MRRKLLVNGSQFAPMRARRLVMRSVQPVVEQQEIQKPAVPIAGVIEIRPRIRMHMLLVVEQHDSPQREESGQEKCHGVEK